MFCRRPPFSFDIRNPFLTPSFGNVVLLITVVLSDGWNGKQTDCISPFIVAFHNTTTLRHLPTETDVLSYQGTDLISIKGMI